MYLKYQPQTFQIQGGGCYPIPQRPSRKHADENEHGSIYKHMGAQWQWTRNSRPKRYGTCCELDKKSKLKNIIFLQMILDFTL